MNAKQYFHQNLIALDQMANTLLGGFADETISSRCHRRNQVENSGKLKWKLAEKFVNALFFDRNHCKKAYESEIKNRHHSPTIRKAAK